MKYKEVVKSKGPFLKRKYVQEPYEITNRTKAEIRNKIDDQLFDTEDAIADNGKLIMLLFEMLKIFYEANFDINNITEEDKQFIDSVVQIFASKSNRFKEQFKEEGSPLINKLFERQNILAAIIDSVVNGG